MRVYIAGKMTGMPDNNRPAFATAWNLLMQAGVDAVSPHFLESAIEIDTRSKMGTAAVYRHVLPVDTFAISSVDAVIALPGWEDSRGAQFEKHFADLIEIPWITGVLDAERESGEGADINLYLADCINQLKEYALASHTHRV